jgi:hypothetical protein
MVSRGRRSLFYGLNATNMRDYVPELKYVRLHPINGPATSLIDNKLHLPFLLSRFPQHVPRHYCLIANDRFTALPLGHDRRICNADQFVDLLTREGRLVAKRLVSHVGVGFMLFSREDAGFAINGRSVDESELRSTATGLDGYLVTEYVLPHSYSHEIYSRSVNTIRLLTLCDQMKPRAFLAAAIHRFGTDETYPVDHPSRGGMYCRVEMDSGRLTDTVSFLDGGKAVYYETHPDTGARIEGVEVPRWADIRSAVLKMAEDLSFLPYMGWDIAVTPDSFKVLEINPCPGLSTAQTYGPMLADPRVRDFFLNVPGGEAVVRR